MDHFTKVVVVCCVSLIVTAPPTVGLRLQATSQAEFDADLKFWDKATSVLYSDEVAKPRERVATVKRNEGTYGHSSNARKKKEQQPSRVAAATGDGNDGEQVARVAAKEAEPNKKAVDGDGAATLGRVEALLDAAMGPQKHRNSDDAAQSPKDDDGTDLPPATQTQQGKKKRHQQAAPILDEQSSNDAGVYDGVGGIGAASSVVNTAGKKTERANDKKSSSLVAKKNAKHRAKIDANGDYDGVGGFGVTPPPKSALKKPRGLFRGVPRSFLNVCRADSERHCGSPNPFFKSNCLETHAEALTPDCRTYLMGKVQCYSDAATNGYVCGEEVVTLGCLKRHVGASGLSAECIEGEFYRYLEAALAG